MMRSNTRALVILSLTLFSVAGGLAQTSEDWRKQPPAPGPARLFNTIATREVRLGNGLTLVMIEDHRSPVVIFEAGIPMTPSARASMKATANETALAEATAALLIEGAGLHTSKQIAREAEAMGGRIASSANDDFASVTAAVISENAGPMIDILADVLLRPTFSSKEIALYKNNRIESLAVERQDPAFLVSEQFNRAVYGRHPYAITSPAPQSVRAVNRAGVLRFYKSNYSPAGAVVVVAGDFDAAKMEAKARQSFGGWRNAVAATIRRGRSKVPARASRHVYLIDRPGSEQADFRVGNRGIARSDADYFPLLVAGAVLGEGTGSRLFMNLRERKGYAYDVSSTVSALKQGGAFFGASQSRTEVTAAAIKEMLAEFDRMGDDKVSDEELRSAKNYLVGLFSLLLSTQGGVAERVINRHMFGLPADYLEGYRARVEAVTAEDVRRVARKYIDSDSIIVVVGDATRLKRELSTFGPVEVFNTEGRRIK